MSSWVYLDDEAVELADAISKHLASTQERVMKMALALLAVDCGLRFELPRKENKDAG